MVTPFLPVINNSPRMLSDGQKDGHRTRPTTDSDGFGWHLRQRQRAAILSFPLGKDGGWSGWDGSLWHWDIQQTVGCVGRLVFTIQAGRIAQVADGASRPGE